MNKHGHLKLTLFSIWATNVLLLVKNLSLLPSHVVAFTVMNSLKFFRVGGFHERRTYKSFTVAKFHNNARRENLFCLICSPFVFSLSREDGNRSILGMLKVCFDFRFARAESISHEWASFTRERYFQHEKIKFVSPSVHVMFCRRAPEQEAPL